MKRLLTVLSLLLLATGAGAKTPVHYQKWRLDDTTFAKQVGGAICNYQRPDGAWAAIENAFEAEGDSVAFVDKAVLRTRVNKDGTSQVMLTWNNTIYTITQKIIGIGWIKISTRQSQWIDSTMDWSGFSADSNICKWTGVSPGVDYRVRKSDGQVEHGIFYRPAFLDSAVVLYDQRPDSLDIALANVMVYALSANIDGADSAIGDVPWRRLKDFGYYSFNLTDQRLQFPGCDTLPRIPVRQYWERRGMKIVCIEYVMMRRVKQVHEAYPSATIWHNDTKKIEGTANVEDAFIDKGNTDYNYGGATWLTLRGDAVPYNYILIRVKNVASELGAGATITACVCSLYCYNYNSEGVASAYVVFKPWVEGDEAGINDDDGDVTYNDFQSNAKEWGTEGCLCFDDGGVDNSQDNKACNAARADRKETAESIDLIDAIDWYGFTVSTAIAQGWYGGTKNEEGIALAQAGLTGNHFWSTEYSSLQPFWVFTYTVDGVEAPVGRRRKIIMENN